MPLNIEADSFVFVFLKVAFFPISHNCDFMNLEIFMLELEKLALRSCCFFLFVTRVLNAEGGFVISHAGDVAIYFLSQFVPSHGYSINGKMLLVWFSNRWRCQCWQNQL